MSVTKEVFYGFAYQLLSLKIKLHAEKNMLELLVWDLPHFFNTNYIATVDCIKKTTNEIGTECSMNTTNEFKSN